MTWRRGAAISTNRLQAIVNCNGIIIPNYAMHFDTSSLVAIRNAAITVNHFKQNNETLFN